MRMVGRSPMIPLLCVVRGAFDNDLLTDGDLQANQPDEGNLARLCETKKYSCVAIDIQKRNPLGVGTVY
jgi:hypothetical protein